MEEDAMKKGELEFEKAITKCGAPLWVLPMPHTKSVAMGVLVHAGTREEEWPKEAGIAHALEHMLFQGNTRLLDSQAVAAEVENTGGALNAWTSKEMTFYDRMLPASELETGARSLESQIRESLLRPENIVSEMKNIVQEIHMYHDSPSHWCRDLFETAAYGAHPLAKETLGTEEAVTAFTQNDFRVFMQRLYYPKNYTFIVVGNTTLEEATRAFDRAFTETDSRAKHSRLEDVSSTAEASIIVRERDIKQAHVALGATISGARDDSTKTLEFFEAMLDGGSSFPLFQEVRDRRGLCYTVDADIEPWSDRGLFQIYIGTHADRVHEALDCIHATIESSYTDRKLFERARRFLLGRTAIMFSSPGTILRQAASDIGLLGKPRTLAEIHDEINAETPEKVEKAVEMHLLDRARYTYAYVVPHGTKV